MRWAGSRSRARAGRGGPLRPGHVHTAQHRVSCQGPWWRPAGRGGAAPGRSTPPHLPVHPHCGRSHLISALRSRLCSPLLTARWTCTPASLPADALVCITAARLSSRRSRSSSRSAAPSRARAGAACSCHAEAHHMRLYGQVQVAEARRALRGARPHVELPAEVQHLEVDRALSRHLRKAPLADAWLHRAGICCSLRWRVVRGWLLLLRRMQHCGAVHHGMLLLLRTLAPAPAAAAMLEGFGVVQISRSPHELAVRDGEQRGDDAA